MVLIVRQAKRGVGPQEQLRNFLLGLLHLCLEPFSLPPIRVIRTPFSAFVSLTLDDLLRGNRTMSFTLAIAVVPLAVVQETAQIDAPRS